LDGPAPDRTARYIAGATPRFRAPRRRGRGKRRGPIPPRPRSHHGPGSARRSSEPSPGRGEGGKGPPSGCDRGADQRSIRPERAAVRRGGAPPHPSRRARGPARWGNFGDRLRTRRRPVRKTHRPRRPIRETHAGIGSSHVCRRLARSPAPIDTDPRICDRSADPDRPAHPVQGSDRLAPATGHDVARSLSFEPIVDRVHPERRLSCWGLRPPPCSCRSDKEDAIWSRLADLFVLSGAVM